MSAQPLDLALDLLRRLPPSKIVSNLSQLVSIFPHLADDLYSSVDQPLQVRVDKSTEGKGREYLVCDYNRDGDSWRSHWSNLYDPPLEGGEEGAVPSKELRLMEIKANEAFDTYRQMYFDGGLSSVYLWDLDVGFAGVVLIKKDLTADSSAGGASTVKGSWDAIHIVEVVPDAAGSKNFSYKLTSTVMLRLENQPAGGAAEENSLGSMDLGGSLTRQAEQEHQAADSTAHIINIGKMVESLESSIRSNIQEIYFGKTRDIVGMLRSVESLEEARKTENLRRELMERMRR